MSDTRLQAVASVRRVTRVRLRPVEEGDLPALQANRQAEADPMNFFGFSASNEMQRRFAANGLISETHGVLAVVDDGGELLGDVSWFELHHGPSAGCRALNIGISLLAEHRGRGFGAEAQRIFAGYLFDTTTYHRLEASTDVDNIAEQRALERAGFTREGVVRGAQLRAGAYRDLVMYSILRTDPRP